MIREGWGVCVSTECSHLVSVMPCCLCVVFFLCNRMTEVIHAQCEKLADQTDFFFSVTE